MISNGSGIDVFEAGSDFIDGVDVHAAFVGEGGSANKGGAGIVM